MLWLGRKNADGSKTPSVAEDIALVPHQASPVPLLIRTTPTNKTLMVPGTYGIFLRGVRSKPTRVRGVWVLSRRVNPTLLPVGLAWSWVARTRGDRVVTGTPPAAHIVV